MIMFILGSAVTLVSMSVSVSLSILGAPQPPGLRAPRERHPLHHGDHLHRHPAGGRAAEQPAGRHRGAAEMLGVTFASLIIMLVAFRAYERGTLRFVSWVTEKNVNLALFMFTIFVVPLILVFI